MVILLYQTPDQVTSSTCALAMHKLRECIILLSCSLLALKIRSDGTGNHAIASYNTSQLYHTCAQNNNYTCKWTLNSACSLPVFHILMNLSLFFL